MQSSSLIPRPGCDFCATRATRAQPPSLTSIAAATRRFDPVRQWLLQQGAMPSGDAVLNNNKFLARVSDIIHHSQYVHLGREAIREKRDRAVRLPQFVFVNNSPGGGLCLMLHECIKYMRTEGCSAKQFEKAMLKDKDEVEFTHMRLFEAIHTRLVAAELIVYPTIHFHPDLVRALTDEQVERYQEIATSHGAVVSLNKEDATHIVVANTEGMAVDGDFCRIQTLQQKKSVTRKNSDPESNSLAYVHWWFFPNSYDEWLPQDDIQGNQARGSGNDPAEAVRPNLNLKSGRFTVCLRWLEDTQLFNEWMTEEVRFDHSMVPSSRFTASDIHDLTFKFLLGLRAGRIRGSAQVAASEAGH